MTLNSDPDPGSHEDALSALEAYLEQLHGGMSPDRHRWVEQNPQLARLLDCLDALDELAVSATLPVAAGADLDWPPQPDTFQYEGEITGVSGDFGKYELLEEIGRGGMGVVYRARQRDLDRTVGLKMILANHLASREQILRFYAEARAAGGLRHPNIIAIYEVGQVHGQHYFTMEYVAGVSLAQQLQRSPMDAESAARCLSKIAEAVEYLHRHGIVHRDLKPSNILLDESGEPRLTDFGLAKIFSAEGGLTRTDTILGTPSYMAPEQAACRHDQVGHRSDIYSLGTILYEMLTGRPPFREESPLDTLVQVLEGEPSAPRQLVPTIPAELETICLRCLEKDPERRYSSAANLAQDLERYLKGEPIEAQPPGLYQLLKRWMRREPALASRMAVLGTYLAVEQIWYFGYGIVDFSHWTRMSTNVVVWMLVSVLCQRLLTWQRLTDPVRFVWAGSDVVFVTLALLIADGVASPLLVGYPLLITGAGLWFRVRLVACMTALSMASYLLLMIDAACWRPENARPFDYHVIFLVALAVMGGIVSYQVYRVRALSRYYEHRPLP